MDPNTTLAELRERANQADSIDSNSTRIEMAYLCNRFATAFGDLDEWLIKGGFLPEQWAQHPQPTPPAPVTELDKAHAAIDDLERIRAELLNINPRLHSANLTSVSNEVHKAIEEYRTWAGRILYTRARAARSRA